MAILRLNIEDDDTLELIGVQSSWSEHRLVWLLNKKLDILLERTSDYVMEFESGQRDQGFFIAEQKKEFSVFLYESELEQIVLVSNLAEGMALYDKGRSFDYLLRIDSGQRSLRDCINQLSQTKGILAVGKIECDSGDKAAKPFNDLD